MRRYGLPILLRLLAAATATAQEAYQPGFQFERGVYPTLASWKAQAPVKPKDIIVDIDPEQQRFFQYLFAQGTFRYPENNAIVYLSPDDVFGYSPGDSTMFYGPSYQFETIGAICVLREAGQVDTYSSFINPGEQYQAERKAGDGQLYILDFETGGFFKCKPRKVEKLLQKDAVLFEKYKTAPGKRAEKLPAFIQAFNSRHPIHFGI